MQASELATVAVQVLTGGVPVAAEQKSTVQELVWGRLGRSTLGSSALARLHEQPGEGSASIVSSVLADELRTDPDFTDLLSKALRLGSNTPKHAPTPQNAPAGLPPLFPPPISPATPDPVPPDAAEVRKVWLLGLPQMVLAYVVITVAVQASGAGWAMQAVVLFFSAGLAAYGAWCGCHLLLRRVRSHLLEAGTVLNVLVLIRLILWLAGV